MHYDFKDFQARLYLVPNMCRFNNFHRHQQQQDIIVSELSDQVVDEPYHIKSSQLRLGSTRRSDGARENSTPPAPEKLIQIIRCNCKTNCDSKKCTCRKHGLECSSGCGDYKGVSCSNSLTLADLEDFDNV